MEDTKVKAIVLDSKDYKDKDKLVTLFTLENGLVSAVAKSVKSSNAKMKFAKEPFCFGDFILVGNNEIKTISSVSVLDTFFDIVTNLDRFFLSSAVLSVIKEIVNYNEPNPTLFLLTLNTLKMFAYEKALNPKMIFCKFLINAFDLVGYRINFRYCANCKGDFQLKRYFNFNSGEIICSKCKNDNCSLVDNDALKLIQELSTHKFDELLKLEFDEKTIIDLQNLLVKNFEYRYYKKIKLNY